MSDVLADPPRWKDHRDQVNLAERAAGRGFRALAPSRPLGPTQIARIATRVAAAPAKPFPWRLGLVTTAALLLGAATAASAAHLNLLPRWLGGRSEPPARSASPAKPHRAHSAPGRAHASAAPSTERPPAPAGPPEQPGGAVPTPPRPREPAATRDTQAAGPLALPKARPTPMREPAEPPAPVLPPPPSGLSASVPIPAAAPGHPPAVPTPLPMAPSLSPVARADTSASRSPAMPARPEATVRPAPLPRGDDAATHLAAAIRQLRVEHAPQTALATLARHETELALLGLAHEVLLVRVEALLLLRREPEVLRLLDGATLTDVAAQRSLLLARGELRAAAGRCAEALGDFELVLAKSHPPDPRAVRGRAACGGKAGESRTAPHGP